jgi:2-hydroxychromene-2-carboxylate isomerase
MAPLTDQPLRGAYARRDWERLARLHGLPFRLPDPLPVRTLTASRACLLTADREPARVGAMVRESFAALFGRGEQIDRPEVLRGCLAAAGLDEAIAEWAGAAEAKERFVRQTDEARRRGVFGSPFFIVEEEPFWGADRLPMLELFLERGGW